MPKLQKKFQLIPRNSIMISWQIYLTFKIKETMTQDKTFKEQQLIKNNKDKENIQIKKLSLSKQDYSLMLRVPI